MACTAGRATRYRAQANNASPITVRISCSDQRVRSDTGLATAPPTFPGRPVMADSPNAVTTDDPLDSFFLFFDAFEFVFEPMSWGYPA